MNNITDNLSRVLYSKKSFIIFSIMLILFNTIGMYLIDTRGGSDLWEHLASMSSFAENPANPSNPYLLTEEPTHLFTPYHLLWGIIARVFQTHPFWLFPFISAVNTFIFLAGIYAFCRACIKDGKYALPLALAMLFFWNRPPDWSGFYNFGLLPITSAYPFWFAFSAALLIIAFYAEKKSFFINLAYSIAAGILFLIHPLSGSFLLLCVCIKSLLIPSVSIRKKLVLLLLPVFSALMMIFIWPYFPVLHTIMGSGEFENIGFAGQWQLFYQNALWRILPSLLGLPFLVRLIVKKPFTFIPAAFTAVLFIYILNAFSIQNSSLARFIIFIAFFGQAGIILTLKYLQNKAALKYALSGFLVLLLVFGISELSFTVRHIAPIRDLVLKKPAGTSGNRTAFYQYSRFKQYIHSRDVVMAPMETSWEIAGIIPCKVVGVRHSNPFMKDFFERKTEVEKFFNILTSNEARFRILEKYSVKAILIPADYNLIAEELSNELNAVFRDEHYRLFLLD